MANIYAGFNELKKAANHLKLFLLKEYVIEGDHDDWDDFVTHLDSSWDKIKSGFIGVNDFEYFYGLYKGVRDKDELLRYLFQSSNAIKHGVDIVFKSKIIDKNPLFYKKIQFTDPDTKNTITRFYPLFKAKLILKEIKNRGIIFYPPTTHLGQHIKDGTDPLTVGIKGLNFYFNYIRHLDKEFTNGCLDKDLANFWIAFNINEVLNNSIKLITSTDVIPVKKGEQIRIDNMQYIPHNPDK